MSENVLGKYETTLPEIYSSMSSAIGNHVMLIVLERSLWKTKNKYPEAAAIHLSEAGIDIQGLKIIDPVKAVSILDNFVLSIVETLGRLIGIQVAEKLTDKLLTDTEKRTGEYIG